MTTKQICQLGFKCPYHRYNDVGIEFCSYPYIRITDREEDEKFGSPEEVDCPLLDYDTPLDDWRSSYEE